MLQQRIRESIVGVNVSEKVLAFREKALKRQLEKEQKIQQQRQGPSITQGGLGGRSSAGQMLKLQQQEGGMQRAKFVRAPPTTLAAAPSQKSLQSQQAINGQEGLLPTGEDDLSHHSMPNRKDKVETPRSPSDLEISSQLSVAQSLLSISPTAPPTLPQRMASNKKEVW